MSLSRFCKGALSTTQGAEADWARAAAMCALLHVALLTLARLVGAVDNWCVERDEQAVISDAVVPLPPRYDYMARAQPRKGQEEKEDKRVIDLVDTSDQRYVRCFDLRLASGNHKQ